MGKIDADLMFDRVLFIGTYAKGDYLDHLFAKKAYTQMASNTVEGFYIDGINSATSLKVDVLSALVTVPFPKCKAFRLESNNTYCAHCNIQNVRFLNFPYISLLMQYYQMRRCAKIWAKSNSGKKVLVIVYAMRLPFLAAAFVIKSMLPDAVVINIVPDLPQYMHDNTCWLRKELSSINTVLLKKKQAIVDGYVLYADKMAEALKLGKKPWIVIEGLYNEALLEQTEKINEEIDNGSLADEGKKKIVMYAGSVNERYGIKLLVNGFINANIADTELHIYGAGNYVDKLERICKEHHVVVYKGIVKPNEAREAMRKADLLVNPRPSEGEYTKYSCPSKTLEYMATGTPVLMTRLDGIPAEYYKYVYAIDDETEAGLTMALHRVLSMPFKDRMEMGNCARKFIHEKKNIDYQVRRLLSFAERIAFFEEE